MESDVSQQPGVIAAGTPRQHVTIGVPSDAAMARVVRMAAIAMASGGQSTIDEIEDVKLAVSEVFVALVEHGSGGQIDLEFSIQPDLETSLLGEDRAKNLFEIKGEAIVVGFDFHHPDLALCGAVLADLCRTHDLTVTDGRLQITATLVIGVHS